MKTKQISLIIIFSLILLPLFADESFSQSEQMLTISTEKESYQAGESIQVSGIAESKLGDFKITIRVFNPVNNLIHIDEFEVNDDGTYNGKISTSVGGLWEKDGTYTIIADYYSSERATTQLEFGVLTSAGVKASTPEFTTEDKESINSVFLEDYELQYGLSGAEIIGITPDTEMKSLIIEIRTYSDGDLRITLPKDVIDTDEEGFFILVDGIETDHEAISNSDNWSFVIPFSNGSEEIEIIGTYVIPEFGTVVSLVLVLAISAIMILSVKNRQLFNLKT